MSNGARQPIRAPRGTELTCKGWQQEAALRMLMNNLDPEVAERPEDLIVYGGSGKAARDWDSFQRIVRNLAGAGGRRDAADSIRQAGRGVPHPSGRAPGALGQFQLGPGVGHVGGILAAGVHGLDHVRADDGRQLDLHRHARHFAGDLRDLRRVRGAAFRRYPQRPLGVDGRLRRHGRRPAFGHHHERRRGSGGGRGRGRGFSGASTLATATG